MQGRRREMKKLYLELMINDECELKSKLIRLKLKKNGSWVEEREWESV